jgi:hypothetical protein
MHTFFLPSHSTDGEWKFLNKHMEKKVYKVIQLENMMLTIFFFLSASFVCKNVTFLDGHPCKNYGSQASLGPTGGPRGHGSRIDHLRSSGRSWPVLDRSSNYQKKNIKVQRTSIHQMVGPGPTRTHEALVGPGPTIEDRGSGFL